MPLTLREITADTVRAICNLVEHPPGYIAPNAVSIAQAYFHPEVWFRAIYLDDEPVGFVMLEDTSLLTPPPAEPQVSPWRFMIDAQLRVLRTSCVPGPDTPRPFYESLGFVFTGELDDDEEVLELRLLEAP